MQGVDHRQKFVNILRISRGYFPKFTTKVLVFLFCHDCVYSLVSGDRQLGILLYN